MHNHDKFLTAQYSLTSLSLSTFSSLSCHCCGRRPSPIVSSFTGNLVGVPPSKERHRLPEIFSSNRSRPQSQISTGVLAPSCASHCSSSTPRLRRRSPRPRLMRLHEDYTVA
ncbi:hypothetical protein M6B38_361815 [Iris pallida]|uniref:Uncharacterized protein n=1 Tax=Iris pallida TaxID=29817 RepID=A0AAX6GK21_IRIPA|nr:hypothetical protein M6B38_361815 [Iris pallida]